MKTTMEVEVPLQRLQDVWINALDSGSISYWCASVGVTAKGTDTVESLALDEQNDLQERYIAPFRHDGKVGIELQEPDDIPGGPKTYIFDLRAMRHALTVMSKHYPRHLADILSGNDDANTADAFVQCAIFGELVYG
jgi:hypothetical protein